MKISLPSLFTNLLLPSDCWWIWQTILPLFTHLNHCKFWSSSFPIGDSSGRRRDSQVLATPLTVQPTVKDGFLGTRASVSIAKNDIHLGLRRLDYMLDEQTNLLLQIELNTIYSFPGLSYLVSELHRKLPSPLPNFFLVVAPQVSIATLPFKFFFSSSSLFIGGWC